MCILKIDKLQTTAPASIVHALKGYSGYSGLSLQSVCEDAVNDFLKYRSERKKEGGSVFYITSPRGSIPFNLVLPVRLSTKVRNAAKVDTVSIRRVLYTALVHYARDNELIMEGDDSES